MESVAFNVDELPNLKRKDLQSLAKRLGIKANQSVRFLLLAEKEAALPRPGLTLYFYRMRRS
jgi:hypothetical protein